jgi:hypothetical protein
VNPSTPDPIVKTRTVVALCKKKQKLSEIVQSNELRMHTFNYIRYLRVQTVASGHQLVAVLQKGSVVDGTGRSLVNTKDGTDRERRINIFGAIDWIKDGDVLSD